MPDRDRPTVLSAVIGLIALSAQLGTLSKQLCESGERAPKSIALVHQRINSFHLLFGRMKNFIYGTACQRPSKIGPKMVMLHDFLTALSTSVLTVSKLDQNLREVAGMDGDVKASRDLLFAADRVKWDMWKETEIDAILEGLKWCTEAVDLMLTIIQCSTTAVGGENVSKLQEQMSRAPWPAAGFTQLISRADGHNTSLRPSAAASTLCLGQDASKGDRSSTIQETTTTSSFSKGHLSNPNISKISGNYDAVHDGDCSNSPVFSKKGTTKDPGVSWSLMSNKTLGHLTTSDISELELPIPLSGLYNPNVYYEVAIGTQLKQRLSQRKQWVSWFSRGLIHNAIRKNNSFLFNILIEMGVDLEEKDAGDDGSTPLILAIEYERLAFCSVLLNKGVNVNGYSRRGYTPLACALFNGSYPVCKLLLDKGARVDMLAPGDTEGRSPLLIAATRGDRRSSVKICELLFDRGAIANVNTPDSLGHTALSFAAGYGGSIQTTICRMLLEKGALVDVPDVHGRTPLSYCVNHWGDAGEICKLLLENGAKADAPDYSGRTPLSYSVGNGPGTYIYQLLVNAGADLNRPDSSGRTPLSYAADSPAWALACQLLIDKGAMVGTPDSSGRTPLSYAAGSQNVYGVCKILLQSADAVTSINIPDSSGRTALSYAVESNKHGLQKCQCLLDKGAMVDIPDLSGRTPLSYAAGYDNYVYCRSETMTAAKICQLLLDHGAAVDTPDYFDRTPLSYAAGSCLGRFTKCKLLLDKGAMVNICDHNGRRPLSYAAGSYAFPDASDYNMCKSSNLDALQLLVDKGALQAHGHSIDSSGRTPLSYAAERMITENCRFLVQNGARCTPDSLGRTPLSYAAGNLHSYDYYACLPWLMRDATIDMADSSGRTPLSYAASSGSSYSTDFCQVLLDKGAAVDMPDFAGRTPLSHAASSHGSYNLDSVFQLLLKKGAMVDTLDSSGRTPLSYACENLAYYSVKVCKVLLEYGAMAEKPDVSGRTPLSYIAAVSIARIKTRGSKDYDDLLVAQVKISRMLMQKGAKTDKGDSIGHSPDWYANHAGNGHITQLFTEWNRWLGRRNFLF